MKKVLLFIAGIGAVAAGSYMLPPQFFGDLPASIGKIFSGRTTAMRNDVRDALSSRDPQQERTALLGTLRRNIDELKRRLPDTNGGSISNVATPDTNIPPDDRPVDAIPTPELIRRTESIVRRLESANTESTFGQKFSNRVVDTVLPLKEDPSAANCVSR